MQAYRGQGLNGRRVVVTGYGLVTCLGTGVQHVWNRLIKGESGISSINNEDYSGIPCKVAGLVERGSRIGQLNINQYDLSIDQKSTSTGSLYALVAAHEALQHSGWAMKSEEDKLKTGVVIGMSMVCLEDIVNTGQKLKESYKKVGPHFVPRILTNMAAGLVSLQFGMKGLNHSVATACTTGLHSIGDASRFIRHGDVDVIVCGGAESCIGPLAVAGFNRMKALSTSFNDRPTEASRPFDSQRDGFVMSEGAGILVLEELEHARRRGANIHAEVLGYGLSADSNHITAPTPDGDGAYRCMKAALKDARLDAADIGYINAHATSTPIGDAAESSAIARLFAGASRQVAVSSTKGSVGHLLGAAGSVEAIFSILACQTGIVPPNVNLDNPDVGVDMNFVVNRSQPWDASTKPRIALTNSFGFGGTNACLCIGEFVS